MPSVSLPSSLPTLDKLFVDELSEDVTSSSSAVSCTY